MNYRFADCVLDSDRVVLLRDGQPVPVEPQVFDLIRLLVENAGRVVTRDEIVAKVWKGRIVSESAISARIAAARKAVGDDGKRQAIIRTVARRGLQFVADLTPEAQADPGPVPLALQRIRYCRTPEGHRIAYALSGSGPPVIRSNPGVASDVEAELKIEALRDFFGAISDRNTLVRFDAVGVGSSDRDGARTDLDGLSQQIGLVADAVGLDRFALYAESGGTHRAIAFAARHPERVSRLVLVGGYVDGRLRRGSFNGPEPIRAMIEQGWDTPRGGIAAGYLFSYFPDGPLETVRALTDMMQASTPKDFALAIRDWVNNGSIAEYLPKVRCPTLVVHARHDVVHPLSEAQKLAAGIAKAELVVLDSGNHMPLPGTPVYEPFLETVRAFLAEPDMGHPD